MRSLLFVPGDRPDRFGKAAASGADALILDLEDSVTAGRKAIARRAIAGRLSAEREWIGLLVRVNPLHSGLCDADLDAIADCPPDAIMLPKAEGSASIDDLQRRLEAHGLMRTPILPIVTETPIAMFRLASYADVAERLIGLTWGAEDLPAAIGAATSREEDGRYTAPYELARSLTLFAAAAAAVASIETVFPSFRDLDGLARYAARAERDGFTGMMAIHPAQVAVINAAFTPSEAALARSHAIVAAFADNPASGAVQIDGEMLDAPHLKHARRLLDRVGRNWPRRS